AVPVSVALAPGLLTLAPRGSGVPFTSTSVARGTKLLPTSVSFLALGRNTTEVIRGPPRSPWPKSARTSALVSCATSSSTSPTAVAVGARSSPVTCRERLTSGASAVLNWTNPVSPSGAPPPSYSLARQPTTSASGSAAVAESVTVLASSTADSDVMIGGVRASVVDVLVVAGTVVGAGTVVVAGALVVDVMPVVDVGIAVTADTAANASARPAPKTKSKPMSPRSTAVAWSASFTSEAD